MSRSYRRTPIISVTCCCSRKKWLQQENKRYRAYIKNEMAHGRYDTLQGFAGRFGNEWNSPRDGKSYIGWMQYTPCYEGTLCYMYGFTTERRCTSIRHEYGCRQTLIKYMRK